MGRYTTSTGRVDFVALTQPTKGADNAAPKVGPVVINEIMYHPQGSGDEWIEIKNITSSTVPLYDPANPENSSVTVIAPSDEDPVPTARLPACTVRFLVPRDIAYARCDCAMGTGCEHVVLAAWAFRQAGPLDGERTIALEPARARGAQKTDTDAHGGWRTSARQGSASGRRPRGGSETDDT